MILKTMIKGTGVAALALAVLTGCSSEEEAGLTKEEVEQHYTEEEQQLLNGEMKQLKNE